MIPVRMGVEEYDLIRPGVICKKGRYFIHGFRTEMSVTEQIKSRATDQIQGDSIIKGEKGSPVPNLLNIHIR